MVININDMDIAGLIKKSKDLNDEKNRAKDLSPDLVREELKMMDHIEGAQIRINNFDIIKTSADSYTITSLHGGGSAARQFLFDLIDNVEEFFVVRQAFRELMAGMADNVHALARSQKKNIGDPIDFVELGRYLSGLITEKEGKDNGVSA